MSGKSSNNNQDSAKAILKEFVDQSPASRYTFDSERGSDYSQICRRQKDQTKCIQVWLSSKQLFEAMQQNGFFCALPMDPGKTHMECIPIPKS